MDVLKLSQLLISFILLIISITLREYGYALAANQCGDPSPSKDGRLTVNPVNHIDLIGTIIFPIICMLLGFSCLFGWGKPQRLQPASYRYPRLLWIVLGGFIGNILLCLLGVLMLTFSINFTLIVYTLLQINATLIVFNLLPLPGLDGFTLISPCLPERVLRFIEQFGLWILLIAINLPIVQRILSFGINCIIAGFIQLSTILYAILY